MRRLSASTIWYAYVGPPSLGGLDPVVWFGFLGVVGTLLPIVSQAEAVVTSAD